MPLPSAPKRQDTRSPFTPIVGEFMISEIEDGSRLTSFPEYGTPHPNAARWPNHVLALIRPIQNEVDNIYEYVYIVAPANQDSYNWEFGTADIGGAQFKSITRTYITLRSAFSATSPVIGSALANTPTAKFADHASYVLTSRKQSRIGDDKLDSLFVVDRWEYVVRSTTRTIGVDNLNGVPLSATESLYYSTEVVTASLTAAALFAAPTNAYWGLQADGNEVTGRQLSSDWYSITTTQTIGGTFVSGVVTVQTYNTVQNFYWPPVLAAGTFEIISWVRRDGGADASPRYRFTNDGYDGPCYTAIVRTWQKTPFTIAPPVQMLPTPVNYTCPFFSINIPACLHGIVTCFANSGSSDPVYVLTADTFTVPTTNITTWPDTIVAADSQEPYRGGYLRTVITISKPS
jgi:hypothetical protein